MEVPASEMADENTAIEVEGETIVATMQVEVEEPAAESPVEEIAAPTATLSVLPTTGLISPTPAPTQLIATPRVLVEPRIVEVEWPQRLHLGDSDVVRLALIPTKDGYTVTTEFPDHETITQEVPVIRPEGYELYGVGRLNGVGFTIAPTEDQIRNLPLNEPLVWHWSLTPLQPGRQRITLTLLLHWVPITEESGKTREAVAYSKGLEIQVDSFFGLTRGQAMTTGLFGAVFGGGISLFALIYHPGAGTQKSKLKLTTQKPNPKLIIEPPAGMQLNPQDESLLKSLFSSYARLIIQSEFLSGYSGARTFLLLPVHADGRTDAYTIAKLGDQANIRREFQNYETFVKHTLPPITARIQNPPVVLPSQRGRASKGEERAALQYTFIGEAGKTPNSLRQALLYNPDPGLLSQLFETFGPNWWMQRKPDTFRLAQEYDRFLPPHYVLEPDTRSGTRVDGRTPPGELKLVSGQRVTLRNFLITERRADGQSFSLKGESTPGQPQLRIRWLGSDLPKYPVGRVIATRKDLLEASVSGFNLYGLPNPFEKLAALLEENIRGTRSIIHGDLNLENILVGPGEFVWLIDFATTREGHPLVDFAHLEAEIIAHVIAPQIDDPRVFVELLKVEGSTFVVPEGFSFQSPTLAALHALRIRLHDIAFKCLANPSQPREYWLALYFSCLGGLKHRNLSPHQKHFLFLTAASITKTL